ncbi:hypothetical protein M427DRAFT_49759 [Gonapodya prolifera JEL478]|uniref:Uncharacterized protein n=1 Tax=Gonapodya prolifera (strain JEL478) TaxID=1344416 RepID=A0A138ZXN9_GONPJ|nr:hypothetical protein M427DRAFT_49759 [Gonapodya prolifera JEL478]|eukprot:KXS09254.1 hypothetical protein M427DRAFT_49759 [Gonapodya prolifera JEL478]
MEVDGSYPYGTKPFLPAGPVTFKVIGSGDKPNAVTHLPDVGNLVARIVLDPRTLNQKVFCMAETLTMNQMGRIYEEETGKKLALSKVRAQPRASRRPPSTRTNPELGLELDMTDYAVSRWIRGNNVPPEGSLKSWELYLDYRTVTWREWVRDAVRKGSVDGAR